VELTDLVDCCEPLVREPLSAEQSVALARVFKALGDPVRLRLLSLIASHEGGEACVCDLTGVFDLSGPTISHHLKVLREAGSIGGERRGTWVYYRLHPEVLSRATAVLALSETPVRATGPRAGARWPSCSFLQQHGSRATLLRTGGGGDMA
jgi:ArsR family transcriptional regulator, arsenate/arsenite/antimonite-responsive transcriptional repressor